MLDDILTKEGNVYKNIFENKEAILKKKILFSRHRNYIKLFKQNVIYRKLFGNLKTEIFKKTNKKTKKIKQIYKTIIYDFDDKIKLYVNVDINIIILYLKSAKKINHFDDMLGIYFFFELLKNFKKTYVTDKNDDFSKVCELIIELQLKYMFKYFKRYITDLGKRITNMNNTNYDEIYEKSFYFYYSNTIPCYYIEFYNKVFDHEKKLNNKIYSCLLIEMNKFFGGNIKKNKYFY